MTVYLATTAKEQDETVLDRVHRHLTISARISAHRVRVMMRPLARLTYSPGDRHIDRVCKEILAGVPGRDPEVRLHAAAAFAEVLDRG